MNRLSSDEIMICSGGYMCVCYSINNAEAKSFETAIIPTWPKWACHMYCCDHINTPDITHYKYTTNNGTMVKNDCVPKTTTVHKDKTWDTSTGGAAAT